MNPENGLLELLLLLTGSTLPMIILISLGYLSRKTAVLREGDERVFSSYVYYFALPGLFITNLSRIPINADTLLFILWAIVPILLAIVILLLLSVIFKIDRGVLSLIIVCTVFGSLVFFGIPYITFTFPSEEAERLASFIAVPITVLGVFTAITTLELYSLEEQSFLSGAATVAKRFTRNPLIISMAAGILLSLFDISLPGPLERTLQMLGRTTSTVAMFLVGLFFYGRSYSGFFKAFKLSFLRLVLLPAFAFLLYLGSNLPDLEVSIIVLLHGMPGAVNLIVLSERYNFYKDLIPTYLLVSTLASFITLGAWFVLTNY
ncbi:MAG: AEC family transporter [Spirochaetia bacterium]